MQININLKVLVLVLLPFVLFIGIMFVAWLINLAYTAFGFIGGFAASVSLFISAMAITMNVKWGVPEIDSLDNL